jgi:hypothetical protein
MLTPVIVPLTVLSPALLKHIAVPADAVTPGTAQRNTGHVHFAEMDMSRRGGRALAFRRVRREAMADDAGQHVVALVQRASDMARPIASELWISPIVLL